MAPKRSHARDATPAAPAATAQPGGPSAGSATPVPAVRSAKSTGGLTPSKLAVNVVDYYLNNTSQRTMLVDAFMVFLVAVGGLQFLYFAVFSGFPYNAFLSGFGATVGQFVLTASLRAQTTDANKSDFPKVSPERAFADYIFCSVILHFFCINFIN